MTDDFQVELQQEIEYPANFKNSAPGAPLVADFFKFESWQRGNYPKRFENGIAIAPVIVDYYENIASELKEQWRSISDVKFYEWLKQPSEEDPLRGQTKLPISRLAAYIYSLQCYPYLRKLLDIYGQDRVGYLDWYSGLGNHSFELDESFVEEARSGVAAHYRQLSYAAYGNQAQPDLAKLKILIVSAPRTGNNWLLTILSHLYDLPGPQINRLPANPTPEEQERIARYGGDIGAVERLGSRWVAYAHFRLNYALVEWAREQGIILLTTIRHPADSLVSLYYLINSFPQNFGPGEEAPLLRETLVEKNQSTGASRYQIENKSRLKTYVRWHYYSQLFISHDWLLSGASHTVRYEDLRHNPVAVLQQLTEQIAPVSQREIERALLLADFKLVRGLGGDKKFYRRGEAGGWQEELPSEVVEFMRQDARYQLFFERLGYTLEAEEAVAASLFTNPLAGIEKFDNGVELPPILVKCFLARWVKQHNQPFESIVWSGAGSFYEWLNQPASKENQSQARAGTTPYITNLAEFLYRERQDVQAVYPAIYGQHKSDFLSWFVSNGLAEYTLSPVFGLPITSRSEVSA